MQLSLGSLKNDDSNGDDNRCRRRCRRRFFARVARFVHFFAVAARLQDESAKFHVLSKKGTPNNNVLCTCTQTFFYFQFRSFGKHLRT